MLYLWNSKFDLSMRSKVKDAVVAAGRNVDTTVSKDTLQMIRDDVILQVTSSIAALVGSIQYGSQGTAGMQASGATARATVDVDLPLRPRPPGSRCVCK